MKGHEIVNHIVRKKMPDREKVRENCHKEFAGVHEKSPRNTMRFKRLIPLTAALVVLLAISTTVFAISGGFDWFMQRFNPTFADIVEPIMAYSEDEGIRMTVIGAQRFNNMAIVYMSLQDVTGQNRLTESTDFLDGFWVSMGDSDTGTLGFGRRTNMLYFDEASNTVYLEMLIDVDTTISDPLTVSTFLIAYENVRYEYEPILLPLADIGEAVTMPVPNERMIGMSSGWGLDEISTPEELLLPGRIANMPHTDSQWISNIGVIDGQFRLQAIREAGEFGASGAAFFLVDPNGEIVQSAFAAHAWVDANFSPVNLGQYLDTYGQTPPFYLDEFVFDVDVNNLGDYTIVFTGSARRGVEGRWRVAAYTTDTANQIVVLTNDIWADGNLYSFITLTPLGLQAMGSFTADRGPSPQVIYVETISDLIPLTGGGGSFSRGTFRLTWQAESPIDISEVTAIIINDLRIVR